MTQDRQGSPEQSYKETYKGRKERKTGKICIEIVHVLCLYVFKRIF